MAGEDLIEAAYAAGANAIQEEFDDEGVGDASLVARVVIDESGLPGYYRAMAEARDLCKTQATEAGERLTRMTVERDGWANKLSAARTAMTSLSFKRKVAEEV